MRADRDLLLEFPGAGFAHEHRVARAVRRARIFDLRREVAARPCGEYRADVLRVAAAGKQMVGVVERDEALGMPRGKKNLRRIFDADRRVPRSVKNDKRAAKPRNRLGELLCRDVLEEFAADSELAPRELDLGFAVNVNLGALSCEE